MRSHSVSVCRCTLRSSKARPPTARLLPQVLLLPERIKAPRPFFSFYIFLHSSSSSRLFFIASGSVAYHPGRHQPATPSPRPRILAAHSQHIRPYKLATSACAQQKLDQFSLQALQTTCPSQTRKSFPLLCLPHRARTNTVAGERPVRHPDSPHLGAETPKSEGLSGCHRRHASWAAVSNLPSPHLALKRL